MSELIDKAYWVVMISTTVLGCGGIVRGLIELKRQKARQDT